MTNADRLVIIAQAGWQWGCLSMHAKNKTETEQMAQAQQVLSDASVFIQSVTNVANRREVLTSEDIYARGGIKLVARGTRLSGGFYERLVAHKLLKPIEQSIQIADAPDAPRLLALAHEQASRVPSLQPLLGAGMLERLNELFAGVRIPAPLAVKLAIMQEDRPKLFQHSMVASVISVVLGVRGNLPPGELHALALASAFHDVGELCIDPAFFAQGHRMTMAERRHLYVHPITGYLMLRDFSELPKGTAEAVLQHHERLDGVGYPYRLTSDKLSRVSRYLAVAEVAASLIENQGADKRIGIKFRMNIQKYDAQAVTIISGLFDRTQLPDGHDFDEQFLIARLGQLGQLFAGWDELLKSCSQNELRTIDPIVGRVNGLRMMVLEPGFDQCRLEDLLDVAGEADSDICTELTVLLDELNWQFEALCRGVERDRSVWGMQISEAIRPIFDVWLTQVRAFISE